MLFSFIRFKKIKKKKLLHADANLMGAPECSGFAVRFRSISVSELQLSEFAKGKKR